MTVSTKFEEMDSGTIFIQIFIKIYDIWCSHGRDYENCERHYRNAVTMVTDNHGKYSHITKTIMVIDINCYLQDAYKQY
jgi:hypothetical protein